jgi:hypothetical protein
VARRVKDFIEISEYTSLDDLIKFLGVIRDTMPGDAEPELKIRGDEIFGHRLTISFLRELTAEEAALEAKYASPAALPEPDESIEQLRARLDEIPYPSTRARRP